MRGIVLILLFVLGAVTSLPGAAVAQIPATYTNDNFWTSEHDRPVSFSGDGQGNYYGVTETGKSFSQISIENPYQLRIQKFMIDEAFFYITDQGVIKADSDLAALSIYLTKVA